MYYHRLLAVMLVLLSVASGQQAIPSITPTAADTHEPPDPLGRDNPQSTVVGFLEACRALDYQKASAYLDLRALPAAQRETKGPDLAKELEELLDRNVVFDPSSLSRNPGSGTGSGGREIVAPFADHGKRDELYVECSHSEAVPAEWTIRV